MAEDTMAGVATMAVAAVITAAGTMAEVADTTAADTPDTLPTTEVVHITRQPVITLPPRTTRTVAAGQPKSPR